MMPLISSASHTLDGRWLNHKYGKKIKVKSHNHSIKVKNLTSNGWAKFYPIGNRRFEDRRGNRIKLINDHTIRFTQRHRRASLTFYRESYNHYNGHNYSGHTCGNACSSGCTYHERYSHDNNGYYTYPSNTSVSGIWESHRLNLDVKIERTNSGLRAKIIGETGWKYYDQYERNLNEFIDRDGNRYVRESNNELVWYPADDRLAVINLRRK